MSVTIGGPADFPALFRSADRESERAQRSYLRSLRVRLGALLIAAFGGALTLTTASCFQVGGGLAFLAFGCALGAELFLATTTRLPRGTSASRQYGRELRRCSSQLLGVLNGRQSVVTRAVAADDSSCIQHVIPRSQRVYGVVSQR